MANSATVGLEGFACQATYCIRGRITKDDPGVCVPTDPENRRKWLLKCFEESEGSTSHHERVKREVEEAEQRKDKKETVKRIRIHRRHFPPYSFIQGPQRVAVRDNSVLPFNAKEYKAYESEQKRESAKRELENTYNTAEILSDEDSRTSRIKKRKINAVKAADPVELLSSAASATEQIVLVREELARLRRKLRQLEKEKSESEAQAEATIASLKEENAHRADRLASLKARSIEKLTWKSVCVNRAKRVRWVTHLSNGLALERAK